MDWKKDKNFCIKEIGIQITLIQIFFYFSEMEKYRFVNGQKSLKSFPFFFPQENVILHAVHHCVQQNGN